MASDADLAAVRGPREACYGKIGALDPMVLAPLVNPSFAGGPRWPALRQAWSIIRREKSLVIASNGLSDPFDDPAGPRHGLRLEVLAETADPVAEPIAESWLFAAVEEISQTCADHGGVRELLDELGALTIEISGDKFPASWRSRRGGAVGALLGTPAPWIPGHFDTPAGDVRLATLRIISPKDLAEALKKGDAFRPLLRQRFIDDGTFHVSSLR